MRYKKWGKVPLAQVFSCGFCEISRNTFFTEHLRATASDTKGLNFEKIKRSFNTVDPCFNEL